MTSSGVDAGIPGDRPEDQRDALHAYLARRPALHPVLDAAATRLRMNSGLRGSIALETLDARAAVQGIGARTQRHGTVVTLQELDRVFREGTRFGMPLVDVLTVHVGEPVVTRADAAAARDAAWTTLRGSMRDEAAQGGALWVRLSGDGSEVAQMRSMSLETGTCPVALVESWLSADERHVRNIGVPARRETGPADPGRVQATHDSLRVAARALGAVASLRARRQTMALPVFAQRVCGDPHGLDADRTSGRLFERALALTIPDTGLVAPPANAEERELLLSAAGLAVDELSSTVAVYHLLGEAPLLQGARAQDCIVTLPLATVNRLGDAGAAGQVVFAVENPAVFMGLLHAVREIVGARRPTIVCTSGNLSLASRRLLDVLVRSGARIRYSGDLDRRGLAIAHSLAKRWPGAIEPWRMDIASYRFAHTGMPIETPETLDACVATEGPAYQEAILPLLQEDVLRWMQAP